MCSQEWEPLTVSHQPTTFDSHKHCISADIMILVCRVISHDHVIKVLCDFIMVGRYLTKFGSHGHFGSGDTMALFFHVILQKPRDQRVE